MFKRPFLIVVMDENREMTCSKWFGQPGNEPGIQRGVFVHALCTLTTQPKEQAWCVDLGLEATFSKIGVVISLNIIGFGYDTGQTSIAT